MKVRKMLLHLAWYRKLGNLTASWWSPNNLTSSKIFAAQFSPTFSAVHGWMANWHATTINIMWGLNSVIALLVRKSRKRILALNHERQLLPFFVPDLFVLKGQHVIWIRTYVHVHVHNARTAIYEENNKMKLMQTRRL